MSRHHSPGRMRQVPAGVQPGQHLQVQLPRSTTVVQVPLPPVSPATVSPAMALAAVTTNPMHGDLDGTRGEIGLLYEMTIVRRVAVRLEASPKSQVLKYLERGVIVQVYDEITVRGKQWMRIGEGQWVHLMNTQGRICLVRNNRSHSLQYKCQPKCPTSASEWKQYLIKGHLWLSTGCMRDGQVRTHIALLPLQVTNNC
jgi:hypothetical protein|eukprot:COSAG01_NODE_3780_length_5700_cov_36.154080_9_plen_199_part_00